MSKGEVGSQIHICTCGLRIKFIQDSEQISSSTTNSRLAKVKNADNYADGIEETH